MSLYPKLILLGPPYSSKALSMSAEFPLQAVEGGEREHKDGLPPRLLLVGKSRAAIDMNVDEGIGSSMEELDAKVEVADSTAGPEGTVDLEEGVAEPALCKTEEKMSESG